MRTTRRKVDALNFLSALTTGAVALRILTFLSGSGNRIEADVGEEDDSATREDPRPSVWCEGVPVRGMDEFGGESDEGEDGDNLYENHDVIGLRRFADPAHQNDG